MKKYKASEKVGKLEYIREQHTTNINLLEAINFSLSWPVYSYSVDTLFQTINEWGKKSVLFQNWWKERLNKKHTQKNNY